MKSCVVTFTGIYGGRRRRGRQLVEALGGVYSGALMPDFTTILVCPDDADNPGEMSTKIMVAHEEGISVVLFQWLEASAGAGAFVDYTAFLASRSAPAASSRTLSPLLPPPENLRAEAAAAAGQDPRDVLFLNPLWGATPPRMFGGAARPKGAAPEVAQRYCQAVLPDVVAALPDSPAAAGDPPPQGAAARAGCAPPAQCIEAAESLLRQSTPRLEDSLEALCLRQEDGASQQGSSASSMAPRQLSPSPAALAAAPAARVTPGPPLVHPPRQATLDALRAEHGSAAARGATFFASAIVHLGGGVELELSAGAATRGATMLYDIADNGERTYAHVVVRALYALAAPGAEVRMQHHYLLTLSEEEEYRRRHGSQGEPEWAAAVKAGGDRELSLSASGEYFSPAHLITGLFELRFPGSGGGAGGGRVPRGAYVCRRAFDPTCGRSAALPRAMAGLRTA